VIFVQDVQVTLSDEERETLRQLVSIEGLSGAARRLKIDRSVISSAIGGIAVRRGSIALLREALATQAVK
jgi:hypothetical protein